MIHSADACILAMSCVGYARLKTPSGVLKEIRCHVKCAGQGSHVFALDEMFYAKYKNKNLSS